MNVKLDYNQIIIDASNRFHAIINACINKDNDSIVCNTCSSMYSSEKDIPAVKEHPILDLDLCFSYKGYKFELTSCNYITHKEQMLGLTNENFNENFPHGVFADRYVCWMYGNKDSDGRTAEEADALGELEYWAPEIYLVPDAWSWGTESDLISYAEVNPVILRAIDKFLESFKE